MPGGVLSRSARPVFRSPNRSNGALNCCRPRVWVAGELQDASRPLRAPHSWPCRSQSAVLDDRRDALRHREVVEPHRRWTIDGTLVAAVLAPNWAGLKSVTSRLKANDRQCLGRPLRWLGGKRAGQVRRLLLASANGVTSLKCN